MKIKETVSDRIFGAVVTVVIVLCVLMCAYPVYLVIINSFSDPAKVAAGKVYLLPEGFTLDAYKVTFENGNVYEGDFADNKLHGKGKYTWPNGNVYEGDWRDDNRSGKGKFTWSDGDVYEGDYVDGKRTGTGTYTYADGRVKSGRWEDGKFLG